MDYQRKKRWVRYNHIKCKMYLRNDFHYECAYCRMREQDTGVLGEAYFEKDHFIARTSGIDMDLDSYDNMIYACSKCNGTKSNKSSELLLNPCTDNIYLGENPHVKNLGKNGQYQLIGNTVEGKQYIDTLQLNSKFYREMRERQEQTKVSENELQELVNEIVGRKDMPDDLMRKLKSLVYNNFLSQTGNQEDIAFRCGNSKAGLAFQHILKELDVLAISYELQFADKDIDIKIQYKGQEYLCEVVLNDTAEKPVRCIHVKEEKKENWMSVNGNHGILYYYMKTGRLELYSVGEENELLICLKECLY